VAATTAQKMTQPTRAFLIDPALASKCCPGCPSYFNCSHNSEWKIASGKIEHK
jgi:hypothetical protein